MNRRIKAWRFVCRVLAPEPDAASYPQWASYIQSVERLWTQVFRFTDAHLVTPALLAGLSRRGLVQYVPPEPQQYMSSMYEMNGCRNRFLLAQLDEAICALNECGIVPVLLKGAAYLKEGIYKDPATRILSDLDVLIAEADIPEALEKLKKLGYRAIENEMDYAGHRHVAPMFRQGDYGMIEIHRRTVRRNLETVLQPDAVWKSLVQKKVEGLQYRLLSPTHMVTLSFLHSQVIDRFDETFTIGLRPIQDLLALDTAYGPSIEWSEIDARLNGHPAKGCLRDYLFTANQVAGFRVPPEIRFGGREWAHYGVAVAQIRWPRMNRFAAALPLALKF